MDRLIVSFNVLNVMNRICQIAVLITFSCSVSAQSVNLGFLPTHARKKVLKEIAYNVAATFGPDYVPYFRKYHVSESKKFDRDSYSGKDSLVTKMFGKEYYMVVITKPKKARIGWNYAAKVRIWKDTGEPLDCTFPNMYGRNFLHSTLFQQTGKLPRDLKSKPTKHIDTFPVQFEPHMENIWK